MFTIDYPKYINVKHKILFENKVFEYYVRIITNFLKFFQKRHYFHVRDRHTKKLQRYHATMLWEGFLIIRIHGTFFKQMIYK